MANDLENLLSRGLEQGYAGGTKRETVQRGPFQMETSQYTSPEGGIYRDEWTADRTGGGQEIVQLEGRKKTRLYAGGTITLKELAELGLTKKDVTRKLKEFIKTFKNKTRLLEDFTPEPDGDWQYEYKIMENVENIPLTTAMETIIYKGKLVFAHAFLHTSIE